MKKRILSGILALTMCFSMTPSIAWGSGMTEFSDGASGESEKKEEFTDEPEIEEEKEKPVAAVGVPEVENGFSDGTLDAAQDTSVTTKHTVTIDTSPSYKIGTDTIYDVINNHDGTLTVGEDPEIIASSGKLNKKYSIKYRSEKRISDYAQNVKNPESNDERYYGIKSLTSIPVEKKINITNICTLFCVVTLGIGGDKLANYQGVENPIKVNYNFQGGSGGPNTDWVWNVDGQWNTDHNTEPTKEGYKFAGWYTQANGNGSKIEEVSQAVNAAVAGSDNYKEITLYAKWVHKHAWKYNFISSGSEYIFKVYCKNANSSCEYYGTTYDDATATVSLNLEGFDNNKCVEYGNSYSVTCANSLPSEIGATIGKIMYADCNRPAVLESETPPTSPGKYKAKVVVTLPGKYSDTTVSADFEIKPRSVQLNWSNSELTYNGQPQTVTAEVSNSLSGDTFTLEYENNETYTNTGTNAQKYRAKIKDLGNTNYSLSEDESVHPWEIKKAPVTLTVVLDEFTYGEQPVIKLQGAPSDSKVVYQYKVKDKDDSTYAGITEEGLKKLSAGEYTLKAVVEETENYKGFSATCDFNVKKAGATDSHSKVDIDGWTYGSYDGKKNTPSIDPSLNPENQTVQYTYYTDEACTTQTSTENGAEAAGEVPKNAGTYYVKAQIPESANYNAGTATGTFEIKPLPVKLDWSSSDLTYNGKDQTVTAKVTNALPGDTFTLTYETNETYTNTGKNARKYTAKVTALGNTNYSFSEEESVYSWEIKKAPVTLTVTLDDFIYGEQPAIKIQAAPSDSKVVYQYKVKDKDDSTYAGITEEGLKKLSAGEYTLKAVVEETENYKGFSATCDFNVKKAGATDSHSKVDIDGWTYGSYDGKKNTPSIDPSLNPENQTVQYTYYTDEACTTQTSTENGAEAAGEVPKNAGTYYVKAQIPESANYNAGTATGTFEIKPLPVKLDWSSSDLTYNGKDQTVTAKVTNALPGDTFTLTYETNETYTNSGKNARKYTAKVTALGNTNYSFSQEESIHPWVINPKAVTVKPDDLYKHIGGEEPQLTYTTDGIVEGETLSGITLQRVSGEDARKYEITATETAGANPNYTVTREKGTFTIEDHNWPKDGKILSPATSWSEGMQERTCTAPGCGQKRYDSIPKQDGKPADPYADKIDKYIQIFGSEITAAALDNEETILFGLFPGSDKTRIDNGSGAKVWLEINHVNNLDPAWQNLINMEIEKTVGKNADQILFDIDLYRQLAGENRVLITNPGINMNIRIKIPDKMINNQPYTIRDYKILRLHKDSATNQATVDILDSVFNSSTNELTFKSDKFSIYVLTYKDTYYSPSYPVTGIKVSPDTLTLTKKDETAQLTAEVTPSYADNKRVTWQSSDEKVATVDENGKVTAVGNGTATITATSVSGSYTATVSVTVKIPVEIQKLTIEAEKETLTKIGESTELKVKIEPENADLQKLIWKSDNEKVATTDENGKVTAVGNGTAEITVTTEDGKITASIMITVKVPDEPTINKTTGFRRLRARSVKQTKTSVTLQWNIIKDADGYFIYGNRCNTGTKSYKYRKLATITGGDISTWTQKDLKKGTYYKYVVKAYRLVNGKKVVTDTSISVHAVTGGGKYGNAKAVSVTQIGNKRNVSKITLKMGKTAQIKAKEVKKDKKIERHRKLCYESSNTKVATVTPDGLIRATGKGTCTIWVYAQNGIYKALKITVK